MSFIKIPARAATPDGPQDTTISVRASQINFAFKAPFQSTIKLSLGDGGPIPTEFPWDVLDDTLMSLPGFIKLPTPEGNDAIVNASRVVCLLRQELSVFCLMFSGGSKLVVKETEENLLRSLAE